MARRKGPGGPPPGPGFGGFGGSGRYGYGWKVPGPIPPTPGGREPSYDSTLPDKIAKKHVDNYCNRKTIQRNTGSKLKGIILGSRLSLTGPLHEGLYVSRIQSVDNLLSEKRISSEVAKYRKLKAAFQYNSYLLKCELLTPVGLVEAMKEFAGQIGAVNDDAYIFEQVMEENGIDMAEYEAEKAKAK